MSLYSRYIADRIGLDDDHCERIRLASTVHDIGKLDVPTRILDKPGQLTNDEYEVVKRHAMVGYLMLTGKGSEVLDLAARIALTHHEHWDGSGYPQKLASECIPIEGRIAAVADVFDALTTRRCYKEPFTVHWSVEIMREGRGRHFDPVVLDTFFENLPDALSYVAANVS
jgi:putative two-component system response regulator